MRKVHKTATEVFSSWGRDTITSIKQVEEEYDTVGDTYDDTLRDWQYESPEIASELMERFVCMGSRILDAGCGTGLSGTALRQRGYGNIIGVDISVNSLQIARKTDAYIKLHKMNLQDSLPFGHNELDAVNCIGVLTYIENTSLLHEFCRIVRPGGYVIFSQRADIYYQKDYETKLQEMEEAGL